MEPARYPIVDISDQIIGFVNSKEELHNQPAGVYHRCSHLFIEGFKGMFILQLKGKNSENAGKLSSSVSGHVEEAETYMTAVIREAKEELGLEPTIGEMELIGRVDPCEETNGEFVMLYSYLREPNERITPNPDEVEAVYELPITQVMEDVKNNPDKYSPAFLLLFDIFTDVKRPWRDVI